MVVVTALLVLATALVAPRLLSTQEGSETRRFFSDVRGLIIAARDEAILRGVPVSVEFAEDNSIVATRERLEDAMQTDTIRSLPVQPGVTASRTVLDGETVEQSDWKLTFYPDGTSLGGGVEFAVNGQPFRSVYVVHGLSSVALISGELPDPSEQKWTAGEHEKRF